MNPPEPDTLGALLEADELAGVSFYDSKQKLLKMGYTEDQISVAVASHDFDGAKHQPHPESDLTKAYEKDPVLAASIAASYMQVDAETHVSPRQEHVAEAVVGTLAGGSLYWAWLTAAWAESIGFPLGRLLALGAVFAGTVYGLHTFGWFGIRWFFYALYLYAFLLVGSFAVFVIVGDVRRAFEGKVMGKVGKVAYVISKILQYLVVWSSLIGIVLTGLGVKW